MGGNSFDSILGLGKYYDQNVHRNDGPAQSSGQTGSGNLTPPPVLPPALFGDPGSFIAAVMIKLGASLYESASQQEQDLRLQAYNTTMASAGQDFKASQDEMSGAVAGLVCAGCSFMATEISSGISLDDTLQAAAAKQQDSLDPSLSPDAKAAAVQQNAQNASAAKVLDAKANYASEAGKGFATLYKATGDFLGAQGKADADVDKAVGKQMDAAAAADSALANNREDFKKKMADNIKQIAEMIKESGDAHVKAMQSAATA